MEVKEFQCLKFYTVIINISKVSSVYEVLSCQYWSSVTFWP